MPNKHSIHNRTCSKANNTDQYQGVVWTVREFRTAILMVIAFLIGLGGAGRLLSQVNAVGIGTMTPDSSAILDVSSLEKGFLPPRADSVARMGLVMPPDGLLLYDTTSQRFWYSKAGAWAQWAQAGDKRMAGRVANKPIPDLEYLYDTLSIGNGPFLSPGSVIQVTLDILHPTDSTVDIHLISPGGILIPLILQRGTGSDFVSTTLRNVGSLPVSLGDSPFTGVYLPESSLDTLQNTDGSGDWVLRLFDHAAGSTGVLENWSISFQAQADLSVLEDADHDTYVDVDRVQGENSQHWVVRGLSGIVIDSSGHVGLGVQQTAKDLAVAGGAVIGTSYAGIQALNGANDLLVQGLTGVGTPVPERRMHVRVDSDSLMFPVLLQNANTNTGVNGVGLALIHNSESNYKSALLLQRTNTNGLGDFYILSDSTNTPTSAGLAHAAMTIKSVGRVGIGTTLPKSLLDVEGSLAIGSGFAGNAILWPNSMAIQGQTSLGTKIPFMGMCAVKGGVAVGTGYAGTVTIPAGSLAVQERVAVNTSVSFNEMTVEGGLTVGEFNIAAPPDGIYVSGRLGVGTSNPAAAMVQVAGPGSTNGNGLRGIVDGPVSTAHAAISALTSTSPANSITARLIGGLYGIQAYGGVHGLWAASNSGGTGDRYGVRVSATSAGPGYRHGLEASASGGSEAWAGWFEGMGYFSGKLGIGTLNPKNKLDVLGAMTVGHPLNGTTPNGLKLDGGLGIGTASPSGATVHVEGSSDITGSYGYLNSNAQTGTSSGTNAYSVYASSRVHAHQEIVAFSDERLKAVLGPSDNRADLAILDQIRITDYILRDTLADRGRIHKKVIAQQLEQVFPEAVTGHLNDCLPDIYRRACSKEGWIELETTLSPGDRVRLITLTDDAVYTVTAIEPGRFRTNAPPGAFAGEEDVFVYGKEVNDFRAVDYDAISMLAVSATQAQQDRIRRLGQQIRELAQIAQALDSEISGLSTSIDAIRTSLQERQ